MSATIDEIAPRPIAQNRVWYDNDSGGFPGFCAVFGIFFALICAGEIGVAAGKWDRELFHGGQSEPAVAEENRQPRKRGARAKTAETRDVDEENRQKPATERYSAAKWHSANEVPLIREGGQREVLLEITTLEGIMRAEYNNYDLEGMPRGFYTNEHTAEDMAGATEPGVRIDENNLKRWAMHISEKTE